MADYPISIKQKACIMGLLRSTGMLLYDGEQKVEQRDWSAHLDTARGKWANKFIQDLLKIQEQQRGVVLVRHLPGLEVARQCRQ